MKRFSIIVPTYNDGEYITQCLESILKQDFQDYEIIVINDHSNDITSHKVMQLREKYPNITMKYIYNEKNVGLGASRNIGMQNATGEYLLFVDSDDYLSCEDALSGISEKIRTEEPDILIFGSEGSYKNQRDEPVLTIPLIPKEKHANKKYQVCQSLINYVWPLCVKRDFIEKSGINFQEDLMSCEDVLFRKQAMLAAKRIRSYQKVCYTYNRRLNRVTLSSNPEIKVTDKLHELVKSYRRLKELTKEEVAKQQGINIKQAGFSFFLPAGVAVVGNHLISKILCKKQEKHKEEEQER